MAFYGIYREKNEAGKPESDRRILEMVGEKLGAKGKEVKFLPAEGLDAKGILGAELVFSMARSPEALNAIMAAEKKGVKCVNSTKSILLCFNREKVYTMMNENSFPMPKISVKSLPQIEWKGASLMLKRTDNHGKENDTFYIDSPKAQ